MTAQIHCVPSVSRPHTRRRFGRAVAVALMEVIGMIDEKPGRPEWPATTFLGRLSPVQRHGLFRVGRRQQFSDGTYVLRQRGTGRDVFIVLGGRVEITMRYPGGRDQRIAVRVPGDIIGELAYVDAKPRSASAAAVGLVSALYVPGSVFTRFIDVHPDVYRHLTRTLSDRLRASDIRQIEFKYDVESRVAAALCQLATTDGDRGGDLLIVHKTQREIGEMIGAATVSVHRSLRKLAGRDCIRTEHRSIVILDFDALADVAEDR